MNELMNAITPLHSVLGLKPWFWIHVENRGALVKRFGFLCFLTLTDTIHMLVNSDRLIAQK